MKAREARALTLARWHAGAKTVSTNWWLALHHTLAPKREVPHIPFLFPLLSSFSPLMSVKAFLSAAGRGDLTAVRDALTSGRRTVTDKDAAHTTVLHRACAGGHLNIVSKGCVGGLACASAHVGCALLATTPAFIPANDIILRKMTLCIAKVQ